MKNIKQRIKKFIIILLILTFSLPAFADTYVPALTEKNNFRGLWVASVVNIDYPSKPAADVETLKAEAIKILDFARDTGFNAVFLQVRPAADALYPSQYFPWSKYLTGKQGLAPDNAFDPLAFWTTEAHNRGLELHAWINPYRVTKKAAGEPVHDFASLAPNNPARLNPSWVVKHSDGSLYFNPGLPEVRQLIINGVLEIIQNYPVDGIHFDDYFYPDKSFNDKTTYDQYKTAGISLDDWRRENVNTLIRNVSRAIKNTGKNVRFGISPFGIWANKASNPLGSDTKGMESYYSHYADSLKWVKEEMIDYITPQIYWNIGFSVADYSKLVSWWEKAVSGTKVDLYIGHGAYKAGSSDPSSPWYGTVELDKQLRLNVNSSEINGSIFYNYKSLVDKPALSATIKAVFEQLDGKATGIPVSIGRPSGNIRTSLDKYYISGSSNPNKPLYLNGQLVENRSSQGYFGILVSLEKGANSFTLSQEGSYATCNIYRETSSSGPAKMSKIEIPSSSTFPQAQEYRMPGEKITLSCQAPIGSNVTVKLGGKSYTMKPATSTAPGSGLYATTYTYVYTIPSYNGNPRIIDLGIPVYTLSYKGTTKTQKSSAKIGVIMKGAPYYAEVTEAVIDTYEAPVSGNGASYELYKGMVESVTGMTGSYARLSSGQWVFKSKVKLFTTKTANQPVVKKAEYSVGDKWDTLKLDLSSPATAYADFDGVSLKINVSASSTATLPKLSEKTLFTKITTEKNSNGGTTFTLTPKQSQRIEGYYVEKTASGLELKIKRRVLLNGDDAPLLGITIMLDPGHGGSESGAIGPLGMKGAEKDINLKTSLMLKEKLEGLGAKVLMTRSSDTTVSLASRLTASRNARPDLFISIHANSMADNVDISKINGFSIFYREALSKDFSKMVYDSVIMDLNRNKHGVNNRNFYVTRGTWSPSFLIESGFVPNPTEFEWLTDEKEQAKLVNSISEAIIKYFMN